jgi:hypothetical protein
MVTGKRCQDFESRFAQYSEHADSKGFTGKAQDRYVFPPVEILQDAQTGKMGG